MHFTGTVYRNPYARYDALLEITQGCTHNKCKFCTMYKDVRFRMSPVEWVEQDLKELAASGVEIKHLQVLSADPFALNFNRLKVYPDLIHKYLPGIERIVMQARVSNLFNKSVDELRKLRRMHIAEIYLGVESGDEWALQRIRKGYHANQIVNAVKKLDEAGIDYWLTYLNGVAGKSHSMDHAIHTAEVFNRLHPVLVGSGSLTLFPGTDLAVEAEQGVFDPLTEKERLIEMKTFLEHLNVDCVISTHHTSAANLNGLRFLPNKTKIVRALEHEIANFSDEDERFMSMVRRMKRDL